MLKEKLKGFVCGVIVTILCIGVVFAQGTWKTINVLENDITVMVNGKKLEKENFLYNDTTYLPLRAVVEAVGKEVSYNADTNTAYIGEENGGDKIVNEYKTSSDGLYVYEFDGVEYVRLGEIINKYKNIGDIKLGNDDAPYILKDDFAYIVLDYYENVMLPEIRKRTQE